MDLDMKEEIEGKEKKRKGTGNNELDWIIAAWRAEEVVSPSGGN